MKKFFFDLFPLILFFAAFKYTDDIFIATAVAIGATMVQFIWLKAASKKIEATHWINLTVIVVFGGATLYFHNEAFIKWKPTVLYWLFSGIMLGSRLIFNRNIMQTLMGGQISLPAAVWDKLNYSWAGFFVFAGLLNLFVAFSGHFTESQWVNFKVFGLLALLVLFVIVQSLWLGKHMPQDATGSGTTENLEHKE